MREKEFTPQYQRGITSVEHRNVDAAGEDHPFGDEPRSFEADLRVLIRKVADDLYESWQATVREYLANSETACLKVEEYLEDSEASPYQSMIVDDSYQPKIEVEWNKKEDRLTIKDNGIGMAASEVDEIFRQIGHSAARDDGTKSGQFGMGALSFVKLVGLDNAMLMTSHSRLNDDNAAYYVTLAGVEPIIGSLGDNEYGTTFQMTPKDDVNIRDAIATYAEWMRVPVRYDEIDEDGSVVFQEDYGNKRLFDEYGDDRICIGVKMEDCFEAFASPSASGKTLLLSMNIDRNDGVYRSSKHDSPFVFDTRILDESGKIIVSSNGNEGLVPVSRGDYEEMLKEARDGYISSETLNRGDVVGQRVISGPHEGTIVVDDQVLDDGKPLPSTNEYIAKSQVLDEDIPSENAEVVFGPNQGRTVLTEREWNEMDDGRASMYIPEDEIEPFNHETGQGDLTLPQPTSDRDRLQSHEDFWKYVSNLIASKFDDKVRDVYRKINDADDPLEMLMELDAKTVAVTASGFSED